MGIKQLLIMKKNFQKLKQDLIKFYLQQKINTISKKIDFKIKKSIDLAYNRIKKFHSKQKFSSFTLKDK